jgi:hypothetical protein
LRGGGGDSPKNRILPRTNSPAFHTAGFPSVSQGLPPFRKPLKSLVFDDFEPHHLLINIKRERS